ncbi:MAG: hypothetical protein ACK4Z6_03380 [Candidatus Methylomirabilales bacterium]
MKKGLPILLSIFLALPAFALGPGEAPKRPERGGPRNLQRMMGTVKAIDPAKGALTVKGKEAEVTLQVEGRTRILRGRNLIALADLQEGEEVQVVYVLTPEGAKVARFVTVLPRGEPSGPKTGERPGPKP